MPVCLNGGQRTGGSWVSLSNTWVLDVKLICQALCQARLLCKSSQLPLNFLSDGSCVHCQKPVSLDGDGG